MARRGLLKSVEGRRVRVAPRGRTWTAVMQIGQVFLNLPHSEPRSPQHLGFLDSLYCIILHSYVGHVDCHGVQVDLDSRVVAGHHDAIEFSG